MNRKNTVDYQELLKKKICSGLTSFPIRKRAMPTLPSSVSWQKKAKPSRQTGWNNVWKLG